MCVEVRTMQRLITLWPVLFTSIVETVAVNVIVPQFVSTGLSNYKMEFRRAAILAALSNRSLCLTTMKHGKTGDVPVWETELGQTGQTNARESKKGFVFIMFCLNPFSKNWEK